MKVVFLLIGILAVAPALIYAQSPNIDIINAPRKVMSEAEREQKTQAATERKIEIRRKKNEGGKKINFINRASLPFKTPLKKEQRQRLTPGEQFILKYADFLRQPRTGLIKLFPDAGCEENANILRVDANCSDWIPNSAFYSFREKEHTTDYLSDITYKNGFFVTDGILSQGILTALGDVPLESVSLAAGGMKFLIDYEPAVQVREALKQFIEIGRGLKDGDYEYRKAVRAAENTTYALRIIAYRGNFYSTYRGRVFDVLAGDKRTDMILAFRVLRKDSDGSVTLLWKEVDRQKAPRVVFPKRERNAKRPRGIR
jgi:hypothetical protein